MGRLRKKLMQRWGTGDDFFLQEIADLIPPCEPSGDRQGQQAPSTTHLPTTSAPRPPTDRSLEFFQT
jgi:hypothetical protein